ncbi:proliferating cell nuclear antigen (pcna) [Candidatus Woesearchaeota archaeon]|nr:proliferating cell nuclear antigen (pcna) [Candidatus Woesearchaeota archaeon]
MRLTLAEPKYLKDSIAIISELVNEARFKITPNAVELVAMDPANVAMVIFKLLSSCFTEYDVQKETEIAINLANLKQILRRAKPSDMLTLELDTENKLKVQLKGNTTRTFSLPIIELEEKEQKIPELNFPISIKTSASILSEAVDDVDIVAESVSFVAEPKKLAVQAEGDLSKAHIDIHESDSTKITAEGIDTVKSKYSIEYLKKMVAGSKIADEVTIQFNKDYPLKLEFKTIDKVMLSFILAPRVEND